MRAISDYKIQRIKEMCNQGLKQTDIANALNISQWTVHKHDPRKLKRVIERLERLLPCQEST